MQFSSNIDKSIGRGLKKYIKATAGVNSGFKSVFLDRYDAHFTAAQHNFMIYSVSRLTQNTTPDAVQIISPEDSIDRLVDLKVSTGTFDTLIDTPRTSTTRHAVWRIFNQLRYGWGVNQDDTLFRPFKNRATGYRVTGRTSHNRSSSLRYGSGLRSLYWMYNHRRFSKYTLNPTKGILEDAIATYGLPQTSAGAFFTTTGKGTLVLKSDSEKRYVLTTAVAGVNHLKTVWYRTNSYLRSHFPQEISSCGLVGGSNNGSPYLSGMYNSFKRMLKLQMNTNESALTKVLGDVVQRSVDYEVYSHFRNQRHLRHHNYRIVVGRYERKLWNYKKTRQYWRYMRWVSHFFFRGLAYFNFFTMRVDIFLVNHLRIRNIALSRLIVRGGHAFIGEGVCRNPAQYVKRYDIVSVSKEVSRWTKFIGAGRSQQKGTSHQRVVHSLHFAKPPLTGGMVHGTDNSYAMMVEEYGDAVNAKERRIGNNWSPFNYFQGQRVVASAWW